MKLDHNCVRDVLLYLESEPYVEINSDGEVKFTGVWLDNICKALPKYSNDDPDTGRKEDKCSALSYAAACMAKYSAAEAIYWTSPELMQFDLSGLFAQFDIFTHEVQSDYEVDHSRQWVDIHFERLKELYEDSVCNQSEFG